MNIWQNPYQRFGFVIVNVLMGAWEERDKELFFGPLEPDDIFIENPQVKTMAQLLAMLGIFESTKEAERNGWRKPVPLGFSDHTRICKKHRVTILNALTIGEEV